MLILYNISRVIYFQMKLSFFLLAVLTMLSKPHDRNLVEGTNLNKTHISNILFFQVKFIIQEEDLNLHMKYPWKIIQNIFTMFIKDGDFSRNGDFLMILLDFL